MKKPFLFVWLMMFSIVAMAQNEQVGNDLVIKNGAGAVVDIVSATENTEMKFDVNGNKLSIKKGGETNDISLDQVKTITTAPAFKLVAQNKYVYTSALPITLHFKLTANDKGEMKPVSGETVTFTASRGTLAPTVTTNDDGVATVEYTPAQSLWAPGFSDIIQGLYTFTDNSGSVSRYTANAYVGYNGDYAIECLTPDQTLGPDEEAEAEFVVYEVSPSGKKPCAGATIEFSAPEGYITTQSDVTDANGKARVTFHNQSDDAKEYLVRARYGIWMNGAFYTGTATAKFITLNYKLETLTPKLGVRNDGSEQYCYFTLFEYHNGEWQLSQKEVEAKFEATNVTLTKTSDKNRGYGFIANFTVGKSFNQGSVTAKCDIQLESGKVWQGVATTELVSDDYLFFRAIPVDAKADIYPEQSQDLVFTLVKIVNGQPQPCQGVEVKFDSEEGTLTNTTVKTDAKGEATTTFQLNKDEDYATVIAGCSFADEQGIWHSYSEGVDFTLTPYKLEAFTPKLAVRNDGSEQPCYFTLYEYQNGEWNYSKKEVEVKFEATNVTLTNTSDKNEGLGVTANLTAGKSFNQGSVTAECDIELDNGHIWHGVAMTELVLDNYQFSRVLPEDDIAEIYPDESQDVVFSLSKLVNGTYQPCQGKEVNFDSQEGTLTSTLESTDAEGKATTSFQLNKDQDHATVFAHCDFTDEQGILHNFTEIVEFVMTPYKLEAVNPKLAVRNDGSNQRCDFALYEYQNGEWKYSQKEVEVKFEATGVTLSETSYMYKGYGAEAHFTAGKDFKEGSVTAKCDIELENGKVWHGVAMTELVPDDYQFSRVLPEDSPAGICPDESQDVVFSLTKLVNGTYQPCQGEEVIFSSPEGTLTSMLELTDAEGKAATSFQLKKDRPYPFVSARCRFTDELGIWHEYSEIVDFFMTPYKLEAVNPKLAVRNDGSNQRCDFALYEYQNGEWKYSQKEVEVKFEATGVTLSETSYMYMGYGAEAHFTAGKDFKEGSITAKCDIEIANGKVWHGVATAELIPDDYQFSRVLPKDNPAGIYPDESLDVVFSLTKLVNGTYQPCQGEEVIFSSLEGTLTSMLELTDAEGKAATSFQLKKDRPYPFVSARCRFTDELGIWHEYSEIVDFILIPYRLKCLTPEVEMKISEEHATIRYELLEYKNGEWMACPDKKLLFTATNGTADPDYALTNENGICQTVFTPTEGATEGTVTGTCTIVVNEKANLVWTQSQTAHITIIDDGIDDVELKKAEKLKENTYEIRNKTTGVTELRDYNTKYSEWTNRTDVIEFQLGDEVEDEQGNPNTKGMVYGFIPKSMVNMVLFLNGQQFENTPGAKFGFGVYEGQELSADFAKFSGEEPFGNIKWSVSRIMIRPKVKVNHARKRAPSADDYTGEYELLYYIVFQNEVWNPETQQMEEGDEYEVYGRGTMAMHIPTITYFVLSNDKDWVRVGESTKVTLERFDEEGATWDWNDTQIVGQSPDYSKARNGEDEGFFSWDAATQTLTSLKSNDNKDVWVYLGLKSNPKVKAPIQVATGDGWKYTMIKPSVDEFTYTGYGYLSFSFDFAPKESEDEKIDFNALEIDPATNPDGYFSIQRGYGPQGWPIYVNNAPAGEYTVRIWVKSNHDVNCTIKVISKPEEN